MPIPSNLPLNEEIRAIPIVKVPISTTRMIVSKANSYNHTRNSSRSQDPPQTNIASNNHVTSREKEELPGPYYAHFQKGALVAIGDRVKCVEDMTTTDFVEAADEAEDLTLDPPSVSSIVMAASGDSASIVFNFVARREEVCFSIMSPSYNIYM